ncbi:hypothetical protein DL98DRAFT_601150 [Cadophora sp. DSE1049]|nr:hypothetical protein DL98DRAFT_601150 [Cadophora sp. DSE1049]
MAGRTRQMENRAMLDGRSSTDAVTATDGDAGWLAGHDATCNTVPPHLERRVVIDCVGAVHPVRDGNDYAVQSTHSIIYFGRLESTSPTVPLASTRLSIDRQPRFRCAPISDNSSCDLPSLTFHPTTWKELQLDACGCSDHRFHFTSDSDSLTTRTGVARRLIGGKPHQDACIRVSLQFLHSSEGFGYSGVVEGLR